MAVNLAQKFMIKDQIFTLQIFVKANLRIKNASFFEQFPRHVNKTRVY